MEQLFTANNFKTIIRDFFHTNMKNDILNNLFAINSYLNFESELNLYDIFVSKEWKLEIYDDREYMICAVYSIHYTHYTNIQCSIYSAVFK